MDRKDFHNIKKKWGFFSVDFEVWKKGILAFIIASCKAIMFYYACTIDSLWENASEKYLQNK